MSKLRRKIEKRMKYNYKRTFFALFLFLIVLGFGVGYAYLSTNLSIDGTSHVKSAKWDVHFENVVVKDGSVEATTEPTISNDTTINFAATLSSPGDYYEFTVDVVNNGTLNAKIDDFNILPTLSENESKYFNYEVKYSTGFDILKDDILLPGTTKTILVSFVYKESEDVLDYPEEDKEFNFEVGIRYTQAPDNYNPCTFEGDLENGVVYDNEQYTYTYDSSMDGWKVGLIDRSSTDPVDSRLCSTINGKPIVSMSGMFATSKTSKIDLGSFDTSHVVNMSNMFVSCNNLTDLDLSNFDTSNVTNMSSMFASCNNLTDLDLSNFDTSNVTNMGAMFSGCSNLETLNLSNFDFRKIPAFRNVISDTSALDSLKSLNLSNSKFSPNMAYAFKDFNSLKEVNLTGVDTSNTTDMSYMFYETNLIDYNLKSFNLENVTTMYAMFRASSIEEIDFSGKTMPNITNLTYFCFNCDKLKIVNLNGGGGDNLSSIGDMLYGSKNIQEIHMKNFNFGEVFSLGNFTGPFNSKPNVEIIDLSKSKMKKVSGFNDAFYGDSKLETLNMSNIEAPTKITVIGGMFKDCSKLSVIDFSSFDLSDASGLDSAFSNVTATTGYTKTQADADRLNTSSNKPSTLIFQPKNN